MKRRALASLAVVLMALSLCAPASAFTRIDPSLCGGYEFKTFDRSKYSDDSKYTYKDSINDSSTSLSLATMYAGLVPADERESVKQTKPDDYRSKGINLVYYDKSGDGKPVPVLEQYFNVLFPKRNSKFEEVITNAPAGIWEKEEINPDGTIEKQNEETDPLSMYHKRVYYTGRYDVSGYSNNFSSAFKMYDPGIAVDAVHKKAHPVSDWISELTQGHTFGKEPIVNSGGFVYPEDCYTEYKKESLNGQTTLITYHEIKHDASGYDIDHDPDGDVWSIPAKRYADKINEEWGFWAIYEPNELPEFYFVAHYGFSASMGYDNNRKDPTYAEPRVDELIALYEKQVEDVVAAIRSSLSESYIILATDPYTQDGVAPGDKVHVVVDTPAKDEAGEDGGTTIPEVIVLGVLGAGAAVAGAAAGGSSEGGEDKKKTSTFKMYINKDFGNQLKKGEEARAVYARIVEVTPGGAEVDRLDLTQQIRVYSSDNSLNVEDGGMSSNGYRCALARVYDEAEPPPEGRVSFFFEGEGGTFTQNVIFTIAVPGIQFFQDNLTLPAGALDEPEFLPFEVSDMGDKYDIEISYSGSEYELELTDATDPEAKDIHFAVFMEKDKEPIEAGVYVEHWLNVTVRNETQEVKASLKIIRMGLGLNIGAKALNCYRVPKKESAGKAMKDMKPADFDTAVTETQAYLITYDAEKHQVIQQPAFPTVRFEPLDSEEPEKKKQVAEALSRLDIQLQIKNVEDEFANCVLWCKGGFLDAPTRYVVRMTLTYAVGETTYKKEKNVLLRSQPCRLVAGVRENYEVDKYDQQITDMLTQIHTSIFNFYFNEAFPIYHMIDRMTLGYDRAYGYDPYQVAKVVDMWDRFERGELKGIGSDVNTYGVADELEALAAATRSWDGFQGIVLRLSLDIMTGGASEIVMVALDVNRAAMDYRKETGGNGTAMGYFKAMALPIAFAVVPGGVARYGKKVTGVVGKAANYIAPNKTAALMKKAATVKKVASESLEKVMAGAKKAGDYVASKIPQGAKNASAKIGKAVNEFVEKVDKMDPRLAVPKANNASAVVKASVNKGAVAGDAALAEAKLAPKTVRDTCIDAAGSATSKQGEVVYNELIAAKKALQANPTSGAAQIRYNQAMVEFKASHAAIEHANAIMPGEQLAMRATLNADIEKSFAEKIEKKFRTKIADKYNVDAATVICDRAAAKSDAAVKFGRDIDWTPKVVSEKGGVKYVSQATADELLEQSVRESVEELCGKEYASKFAKKGGFARKLDQTACTIQHKDYFVGGLDTVKQVTDKTRMGEYMGDKARSVADTLRYKGIHPYTEGVKLEKEVMSRLSDSQLRSVQKELEAFAKADAATARTMKLSEDAQKLMEAYALMEEGMYQPAKYGRKVVDKDWVGIKNGYSETLTTRDHTINRILERGSGQAKDAGRATMSEVRHALEKSGTSIGEAIETVGDAFVRIDTKFGYGTTSQTLGAVGAGGGINALLNGTGAGPKEQK